MENKTIWFRAKRFGWGWYPISWQGWIVMLLYVISIVRPAIQLNAKTHSVSDFLINFSIPFIINTVFLLIICYVKGEVPKWRWNGK